MIDMLLLYCNETGITEKVEYKTIMDFLDDMENEQNISRMRKCNNFRAVFFENKFNTKDVDIIDELIKHCNEKLQ